MKRFKVENTRRLETIVVTVHKTLPTDDDILYKTGWNKKDCIIKEVHSNWDESLSEPSHMDNEHLGED